MQISELTGKMNEFVESKGWYKPESTRPQTQRNLAISIALESSEILEHFQWSENCVNNKALSGELADVALYLLQLAFVSNIDLEKAISEKLEENQSRSWNTG